MSQIGRQHIETEESLRSVRDFARTPFAIESFVTGAHGTAQILSIDMATGESTQRVSIKQGWRAPIGHFTTDVEIFVLSGMLRQGGYRLGERSYSFIPAGMPTGPWHADEDTVLLWMPDATPAYVTDDYAQLAQIAGTATYHAAAQQHVRVSEYLPVRELRAMSWESTSFLPPGSARKSLYTHPRTGRATWVLGLVPMWSGGMFYESHPTTEEAYLITGDMKGCWSLSDDPFNRRQAEMGKDGYFWRPAHIPHGPFWTDHGVLLLFRCKERLACSWMLHEPASSQHALPPAEALHFGTKPGRSQR